MGSSILLRQLLLGPEKSLTGHLWAKSFFIGFKSSEPPQHRSIVFCLYCSFPISLRALRGSAKSGIYFVTLTVFYMIISIHAVWFNGTFVLTWVTFSSCWLPICWGRSWEPISSTESLWKQKGLRSSEIVFYSKNIKKNRLYATVFACDSIWDKVSKATKHRIPQRCDPGGKDTSVNLVPVLPNKHNRNIIILLQDICGTLVIR